MARHPKKEIEAALEYARSQGWSVIKSRCHCWGIIRCPHGRGGCQKSVWSTPKNAQNHANAIRRFVDNCPHQETEEADHEET
jgi:hypothetical protein